jgi:hypothetical protein
MGGCGRRGAVLDICARPKGCLRNLQRTSIAQRRIPPCPRWRQFPFRKRRGLGFRPLVDQVVGPWGFRQSRFPYDIDRVAPSRHRWRWTRSLNQTGDFLTSLQGTELCSCNGRVPPPCQATLVVGKPAPFFFSALFSDDQHAPAIDSDSPISS